MYDWFRNEVMKVIYDSKMEGKPVAAKDTLERLKRLGGVVGIEAAALLRVPNHIVITHAAKSDLVERNGIPPSSITVIPNGLDTALFQPPVSPPK